MAEEIISTGGALIRSEAGLAEDGLEVETRCYTISPEMHGWRIDRALAALTPEFSRSYLQQLLADGAVLWRGEAAQKASAKVKVSDALTVELRPTQQAMSFIAQAMPLDVVFEDAHLMVIVKPAGLVVHPAAGHWSGTLLNGLLAHHAGAAALPRAGIVHRLDKDTSGLMLVGKSRQAVEALVRAIAARDVKREYLALAHGAWKGAEEVTVDQAIGRDSHNRLRMAVIPASLGNGKVAQTILRPLDSNPQATLLACRLHTGRTHQIRVHAAWLGQPLVGDTLYGGRCLFGIARQALHATRLRLLHPVTGVPLAFDSPPPPEVISAIKEAGLHYNGAASG
ncbi:MAG: RluA family pseudouridine synthase [Hydrogenophaga sp.]